MKKYIGVDIGGTTIKGLIIDSQGKIFCEKRVETGQRDGGKTLSFNIADLINRMIMEDGGLKNDYAGIGIGCPGIIDSKRGTVIFAGNLKLENYNLAQIVSDRLGMPVKLANDANAAALGEAKFGAGKKYSDSILITLGTGVGGGVIIDGKLFEGYKSAGAELGHMVIAEDGLPCTCGRKGCLEAYSSATALIKKTKEVMLENQNSRMWQGYTLETVSGKTAFDYPDDAAAQSVVNWYVKYLACGIINFANIFRPQVIMLGGGVSAQGERLTKPLQEIVNKQIFAGNSYSPVKVVIATLGNDAGAYGAAALNM